ncbi:MAG: phage minor capsid protein [Clostridia bacterium]
MLSEKDFAKIERQANQIYANLELDIIEEIATRIANFGYANTVVINDIKIAQEMGVLYQDIVTLVAKYNNTSFEEVNRIFTEASETSLNYDDKIYKEAGLNPKPLSQTMNATVERTAGNLQNLCMTTANTAQTQFYNAINSTYMYTSTGVKSYTQAILDEIKNISKQGAIIQYPSGARRSVESAVRMNVITAINQNCGKLQELRADELGWDLMEITAHSGARPEHARWQGKIVSRSGKKGYLNLRDIGYGEVTGFKGVNCRHDWHPYLEGSARTYSQEQLNAWKNEKVEYNGKKISKYEATQIQRKMERQIRNDKKQLAGLQGILKSNMNDNKLILETKTNFAKRSLIYKTHQNELDDFIKQTSLVKDNSRLYMGNQDKNISTQIANVTKIANKYNNSDIIGSKVNGVKITEIGEHIISRTYARNITFEDVQDTLKNPIGYGTIKEDSKGRKSFYVHGKNITIAVNPETGKLATVRQTSRREKKKYGIEE